MQTSDPDAVDRETAAYQDPVLTALELISDGATLCSEDGIIRYANPAEERLFGYGAGDLVGRHVSVQNAYSNDENERIVGAVLGELATHGGWTGEWLNRRSDGSAFITSTTISAVQWRGQRHWLCVRQESGKGRLNHSQKDGERLAIAAEAAELGVWEWDVPANTFIYSARARLICGFPLAGDITYDDVARATHPDDFPHTSAQAKRALDPAIRDRTPFEYRIVRPDGSLRWVRAYGYAVFTEEHGIVRALRYIGTLEDITERVAVHKADEETARQVRLALESARMAVWSINLTNGVITPSREFNQLFGLRDDATPTIHELEATYAPGVLQEQQERWQSSLAHRSPTFEAELKILREEEERWLHVRCDVRYGADGSPERAFGIIMDITEQRRTQEALRESDARFREAADSAPAPVWMTDSEGKVEFGNRAMAEFAGLSREDVMGDAWLARMHPEDIGKVIEERQRAWAAGHLPYMFEARFRRADGAWRWLEVNSRARRDANGRFRGYVGLAVDRTDARNALATLVESEERFRLLADSAPVMIWMSDPKGACLYLNAALRRFWNVEAADLQSFDWRATMHPEDELRIVTELVSATAAARPFTIEGRYLNAEGAYRVVQTRGEPRFSKSNEFLGMIGVNVDMTEVVEAREKQRLLLDELNHRVKNTLTVVQSLAKQTFKPDSQPAQAREAFDARLRALAGAHTLLTQSNWRNARLRGLADQAVLMCAEARHRIEMRGPDLFLTPKQALSIALALHELCTNAVKHGALTIESGQVALDWGLSPVGALKMVWLESGGPTVQPPQSRSFGTRLLEHVVPRDVQGEAALHFPPTGVRYELTVPLEHAN